MISALGAQPGRIRYSRNDKPTFKNSTITGTLNLLGNGDMYVPGQFRMFFNSSTISYVFNSAGRLQLNDTGGFLCISNDTVLSRLSSGVFAFGNAFSSGSTTGSWKATNGTLLGTLSVAGTITPGSFTVSTLPSASTAGAFATATVTDAQPISPGTNVATFGGSTPSSSTGCIVQSDGTNWIASTGPATYISQQNLFSMSLLSAIY